MKKLVARHQNVWVVLQQLHRGFSLTESLRYLRGVVQQNPWCHDTTDPSGHWRGEGAGFRIRLLGIERVPPVKARKAREVSVGALELHLMLDGERGEMSICGEVSSGPGSP